jgi:hypothetical protein
MDATQWAGVAAFGSAAAGCISFRPQWGRALAAINACLAAECALGLRHGLHDRVIALLGDYYPERQPLQILLVLLAGFGGLVMLVRRRGSPTPRSAMAPLLATGAALVLFVIETISLHAIDRLLYHPAGPILVIGWAWLLLAAVIVIGALRSWPRSGSNAEAEP